jgi:hypothetical protein
MGFGVLTVVLLKIKFLWDVTPCQQANTYRRFEGTYAVLD